VGVGFDGQPLGEVEMFRGAVRKVKRGKPARFRAFGDSMAGIIRSAERVTVEPVDPDRLELGDVVIAEVNGVPMLHLVRQIDADGRRVEIAGSDGSVNGWTPFECVYAICTVIGNSQVPGAAAKVRRPPMQLP
jgi:hypothetical protein